MIDQLGAVESPQSESVSDASSNDLRGMLGTEQPVEAVLPEQGQYAPEPLAEEAPQEALPFEEEIPEGGTEGEQLAKRRIRPRTPEDQQVIDLYRSEGFDGGFDDAARIIYGAEAKPSYTQPTTEQRQQPSFSDQADKRVSSIQQEIVELEAKVNEATENLETGEALALQRQIMKKEMEAQDVRTRKASYQRELQRSEEDAYRHKAVESRDNVYVAFPQLAEENSVPRRQFDDFVASAQNDPDYAVIFDSPKWPEIMAREFAGVTGMGQVAQAQAPQQMPQQRAPVMGNQARVLTSGTTSAPTNAPLTAQGVVDGMPNMTNEQLYQMLGNAPQPANLR
jgi:hypothetical protein